MSKNKNIFLLVGGSDFSALDFERNFDVNEVYNKMVAEGKKSVVYDEDDYYIEVSILEFGEIDPDFISFVINEFCDYDDLKSKNFYQVNNGDV